MSRTKKIALVLLGILFLAFLYAAIVDAELRASGITLAVMVWVIWEAVRSS